MQIYITDKTGKRFWNTDVTAGWAQGERNNMAKRLEAIKSAHKAFAFVDAGTARIVEEADCQLSDDELLTALEG